MSTRIRVLVAALLLAGAASAQHEYDVVVDTDQSIGGFTNVAGVTCGPWIPHVGGLDISADYKWMGVPSVRIHDCQGWGDIHKVFPNPSADPYQASSYDFTDADRLVNSICGNGMKALYRVGHSFDVGQTAPPDFDKYAVIVEHIARHYTQGWANGYRYGAQIEWEVWNEANLRSQWTLGSANFYTFYGKIAAAIRRADPSARVGTCGLAVNWPGDYQEGLIRHCAQNSIPLDFFSWHYYGSAPHDYTRHGHWVRSLLDRHGLEDSDVYLSEWNIALPGTDGRLATVTGAAYALSAILFMQDGGVDLAHHYRGDICDTQCGGLFYLNGTRTSPTPRANAFHLFSRLLSQTPVRLHASGTDRSGFAVAAGRSQDGSVHQVLVSDFWSEGAERRLRFRRLPRRARTLEVFDLTSNGIVLSSSTRIPAGQKIEHALPRKAPWVQLIKLTDQ